MDFDIQNIDRANIKLTVFRLYGYVLNVTISINGRNPGESLRIP